MNLFYMSLALRASNFIHAGSWLVISSTGFLFSTQCIFENTGAHSDAVFNKYILSGAEGRNSKMEFVTFLYNGQDG